jgi:hypothetical protein
MNLESDQECAKGLLYHKNTCVWKTARKRHHTARIVERTTNLSRVYHNLWIFEQCKKKQRIIV